MAGYRELRDERKIVETAESVECTQGFIELAGGVDSLPDIGDGFSVTSPASISYSNCKCRKRDYSYYWYDHDAGVHKQKIVCSFSTRTGSSTLLPDSDVRRFQMGGEVLTIPNNSTSPGDGWIWAIGGGVIKQPIYLNSIMGSFTAQKELASDAAKNTWLTDKVFALAGHINNATFEGFRTGSVLFSGMSGGTQVDDSGDKIWLFELEFNFRIITGFEVDGDAVTQDDWLYLIDKDAGGDGRWDKPKETTSGRYLYPKGDLTDLL